MLNVEALDRIFEEIHEERVYQEERWGTEFDDRNTANDWVSYIIRYASNGCAFNMSQEDFETAMKKVATLAVAAIETSRRNGGPAKRHYDA